ncbi:hypothetical protein BGY98DRAFT_998330, partial [Russula aff. rugulosa BPL654]
LTLQRWESRHSEYAGAKGSQRRGRRVFELLVGQNFPRHVRGIFFLSDADKKREKAPRRGKGWCSCESPRDYFVHPPHPPASDDGFTSRTGLRRHGRIGKGTCGEKPHTMELGEKWRWAHSPLEYPRTSFAHLRGKTRRSRLARLFCHPRRALIIV